MMRIAASVFAVAATLALMAPSHTDALRLSRANNRDNKASQNNQLRGNTPPPTWPPPTPPNFHGYIVTGEAVCDDFLCPDWSLGVTRLATECFTWDCQYEELQLQTLIPKSPSANMILNVDTAMHTPTRTFYTVSAHGSETHGRLFASRINGAVNTSTPVNGQGVVFSWPVGNASYPVNSMIASLEVTSGSNEPVLILRDGRVAVIDTMNGGNITVRGRLFDSVAEPQRMALQATAVDADTDTLYVWTSNSLYERSNNSDHRVVTFDLKTWKVVRDVKVAPSAYMTEGQQFAFQMNWIPHAKALIFCVGGAVLGPNDHPHPGNGQWDSLIWLQPQTGETAYYAFDLLNYQPGLAFYDEGRANQHTDDTMKTSVYDARTKMLYFQCSQYAEGEYTESMCYTPIPEFGQSAWYIDFNLQPISFGFMGYQWLDCIGKCPT